MRINPKELPLNMQEQVAMAFVAQPAKAQPLADRNDKTSSRKVYVRRLRFKNIRARQRYLKLREESQNETISDLVLHMNEKFVIHRFTYCVMEEY